MSRRPWMPLWVADYLGDTRHLSTLEHGAYLLLIMHYWQTGALPIDDDRLARISGLTIEQWLNVRSTLVQLFDENWRHDRVEHELAEAERRTEKARNAGKQSAKSRAAAATVQLPLPSSSNQTPTKRQPSQPQSHSQEERKSSAAGAAEPNGSPPTPVYTDARHELWAEGTAILTDLGVKEKAARSLIGRWLKQSDDNAEAVLGAIQRARDGRVIEPIAWISKAIKPQANGNRHAQENRSVHAAADQLVDLIHGLDADLAGTGRH